MEAVLLGGVRRALGHEIAEPLNEIGQGGIEADEDHAAPPLRPNLAEAYADGGLGTEVAGVDQEALFIEGPSVIAAHQVGLMTNAIPHNRSGAMRAHVVKGP